MLSKNASNAPTSRAKRSPNVVERLLHANLPLEIRTLLVRARDRVHSRVGVLREGARHRADGACCAGDDDDLARFEVAHVEEALRRHSIVMIVGGDQEMRESLPGMR